MEEALALEISSHDDKYPSSEDDGLISRGRLHKSHIRPQSQIPPQAQKMGSKNPCMDLQTLISRPVVQFKLQDGHIVFFTFI